MFLKAIPLDFNNHNYLYNMMKTNNHIKKAVTDSTTNTDTDFWDTDYWILHPEVCTNGKDDIIKENRGLEIFICYFVVCFLLVILVLIIISKLMNIVKEASCSNSDNEKTSLLKNKNSKNNNNKVKPPKLVWSNNFPQQFVQIRLGKETISFRNQITFICWLKLSLKGSPINKIIVFHFKRLKILCLK